MMVDINLAIGVVGMAFLIIAWLWESRENFRRRKVDLHLHFSVLYIMGNVALTIYAWLINSAVFFVLGLFLFVSIVIETAYAFKIGKLEINKF